MNIFTSKKAWVEALSQRLQQIQGEILSDPELANHAVIALPGGSTPFPLYQAMAETGLDWNQVWLCSTDERCVPKDDAHRNDAMIQKNLQLTGERFISFDNLESWDCSKTLHTVVLGMGEDGHFASLFPPFVPSANEAMLVKGYAPKPPYDRISLSFPAIANATNVILIFTGETKAAVFKKAQMGVTAELPVSYMIDALKDKLETYCIVQPPSML